MNTNSSMISSENGHDNEIRCAWCGTDPLYVSYHDREWGVPVHDDRVLYEYLTLDGAQAGLSWLTILKKRENYRRAFHNFDFERIARYDSSDISRLMSDRGIVRNRLKIEAAITNAGAVIDICEEFGSFDAFVWRYVDGRPIQNAWKSAGAVPSSSRQSDMMSRDLKKRGFRFAGTVICYAFMQASGMVNDHLRDCFRYEAVSRMA